MSNLIIFIIWIKNTSNIFIYSKGFLDCFWPKLFNAKSIDVKSTWLNYICIRVSFFRSVCTRNTYVKNIYIGNAYVKDIATNDPFITDIYIKKTCAKITFAIFM